ncbi:calcium-binding protein [Microvirga zambiensis]|uniref:calcium-binding protein n=1 Tax=Microvirga zambiensis TaxID=1402137 RepID=UPI00191D73A8|nr:calcium-binding protein [Microvirga zambiensis]
MAVLTFSASMPEGLRLQALFSAIVDNAVIYGIEAGADTGRFQVTIFNSPVDVLYRGSDVAPAQGEVSSLQFGPSNAPWLTYSHPNDGIAFVYDNLLSFHARGAISAAVVMAADDQLIGSWRGDYLEGYGGDDWIDGGTGADTMDGGAGNDTFIVDHKDDRIFEANGGGYDVIWSSASFSMAPDAEIEELRAASGAYSLALGGNGFRNLIVATSGNDEIDGKGGVDTLIGGAGDDLYIVDDGLDVVLENDAQGYDTVIAEASYSLGDHIEVLKAVGGLSPINLHGNALANEIVGNLGANWIEGFDGDDRLYGDGGNDTVIGGAGQDMVFGGMGRDHLDGGEGNDTLYGDIENDVLRGSSGDDSLYGGSGNDALAGGDGDDQLYGDVGNDTIDGGTGNDCLYGGTGKNKLIGGSGHDTLYGSMHSETLQGGNDNDRLYGDAGNDFLEGGAGRDTLSGGWGKDAFIFRSSLSAKANVDTISDFNVQDDTIRLDNLVFKKLGRAGSLNPEFFNVGNRPQDGNDYLTYTKSKGYLTYDADGSGNGFKPVLFAKLKAGLNLTSKDFYII